MLNGILWIHAWAPNGVAYASAMVLEMVFQGCQ